MDVNRLKRDLESSNSLVRETMTKFLISGEMKDGLEEGIELIIKKDGLEVKWRGHIEMETEKKVRCDMGHQHPVIEDELWVWNYCRMNKKDINKLIKFLVKARNYI